MQLQPPPYRDNVTTQVRTGMSLTMASKLTRQWESWFALVVVAFKGLSRKVGTVALTAQGAAIGATTAPTAVVLGGLYLVRYYIRVTRAATTSSSVRVTIAWTGGGVAMQEVGAALTGNTTATHESGTMMIRLDPGTTVSYAVAYASVGGTSAQYSFDLFLEEMA
jgi:Na+/H+-translocating membrane pyrophosphatase